MLRELQSMICRESKLDAARRCLSLSATGAVAIALFAAGGCKSGKGDGWKFASLDPLHVFHKKSDKPEPQVPTRMVTTWTDTILTKPGQPPQRGFGGRLVFQGPAKDDPVAVEGQLVVYAFDETDRPSYETRPTRRFIFPADQFRLYESASQLGPSYSVWLPWDDVGGPQKKISLIARFEPKGGSMIVGEQTRHFLPGPGTAQPNPIVEQIPPRGDGVEQAGYQALLVGSAAAKPLPAFGEPASRMQTTTIALPKRMGNTATARTAASSKTPSH